MKITISGVPGSGKSSVARKIAEKLGMQVFSTGDRMREIAKERGVSLLELSAEAEKSDEIDRSIDSWSEAVGEANENFVMDSRIGFVFIPDSVKIFLNVSYDEAAKRIYNHIRPEERENTSLSATFENTKARRESEKKRYMEYYNINYENPDNYDLVIDTTKKSIEQVAGEIIDFVKSRGY